MKENISILEFKEWGRKEEFARQWANVSLKSEDELAFLENQPLEGAEVKMVCWERNHLKRFFADAKDYWCSELGYPTSKLSGRVPDNPILYFDACVHNAIAYSLVVRLQGADIDRLLCLHDSEEKIRTLLGDEEGVFFLTGDNSLFDVLDGAGKLCIEKEKKTSAVFCIRNHGIFVAGNSFAELESEMERVRMRLSEPEAPEFIIDDDLSLRDDLTEFVPALRMMLSETRLVSLRLRHTKRIAEVVSSENTFVEACKVANLDQLFAYGNRVLFLEETESAAQILEEAAIKLKDFVEKYGTNPRLIGLKDTGVLAVGESACHCQYIFAAFSRALFIQSQCADKDNLAFIPDILGQAFQEAVRDAETQKPGCGRMTNKIVIVTGAAMGFGEGIARHLTEEGANVVVADINEEVGRKTAEALAAMPGVNDSIFVKTNVADLDSLSNLMKETVATFGGLDTFISNAGVLRAGGLDEMTPEQFHFVTEINYTAYFYCAKVASKVLKLQHQFKPDYFSDIIQINSKSGLKGSKKNFAYAGGKFGGIGLTQSFALELAPYNIKVNAVCPGNFYEGPLWSDPENGLFVQYLNAGKVPGAKTVADVKEYYLSQVPLGKGCSPRDVVKAILYLVEQENETGQALPVSGGQEMLK